MKIGVLALQGSVEEHIKMLEKCKVEAILIKAPHQLNEISGLIIPGGESTTIGKLIKKYGFDKEIKRRYLQGMPIYGTCAGAILLAKNIIDSNQPKLGLMDISIKRNEYGRQIDSFEANLNIFDKSFKGIFIRAPVISSIHDGCKILAEHDNKPVLIEQNNLLVSTFHPELTDDLRLHKYFIEKVDKSRNMLF
jgi:5'-phosphate synthase pdxT subunit